MTTTVVAQRRVLGYVRVSTERQAGEHHASLETQEAHILDYIERAGDIHIETFVDILSGRRDDRPEYNRMVELALRGGADVIVVQFLDRLGRNPREILRRIWQLEDHGVRVEVTDEDIKEELLLLIRAGMAGAESRKTSERVIANKYGRTTGQTKGQVIAINATVDIGYDAGVARFVGQIIISPGAFSAGGDSGSLIVDDSKGRSKDDARKPVGLLFAGSRLTTIANPIDLVLDSFGVTVDGE